MLGDSRTNSTPKTSPSSSPRPLNKPEFRKEIIVPINKEQTGNVYPETLIDSLDGKSTNSELNQLFDTSKTENNSSKEKKIKKKSFWLNSFYPTYKSRSEDFKRIFKEVPDDERLIVDYSCAVQKEILVHGRLYVTQNFLCFYANIFGWETNIVLKWKDVASITKEKTALVIPNAILISTKIDKFFFTSFVARDKVYLMLFRVWQNALMDKPMTTQEMWQWVHQSYGAELGLTSDDEDYVAPGSSEDGKMLNKTPESIELDDTKSTNNEKSTDFTEKSSSNFDDSAQIKGIHFDFKKRSTDISESDFSDLDLIGHQNIQDVQCTFPHDGRQLLNETLPIHVDQLFTLLFTNSKFYLDFHASRKTTDLIQTPWNEGTNLSKTRVVNLNVALSQPIGPKTSQVTETQIMHPCSRAGVLYSITTESISGGVPYSDSFYIETHYCIKRISDRESSLIVHAQIKFKKSVWGFVKSVIEKNCWSGLEDFFKSLGKALQNESEEYVPDIKRKTKRKRKLHTRNDGSHHQLTKKVSSNRDAYSSNFTSEKVTIFIFIVLILMLFLNAMLYHKLWILEDDQPFDKFLNAQLLKNPPNTHEDWLKLIKKQETMHNEEMKNWRENLKTAIISLKQAEDILKMLQKSLNFNEKNTEIGVEKTENEVQNIENEVQNIENGVQNIENGVQNIENEIQNTENEVLNIENVVRNTENDEIFIDREKRHEF